jgi:uncharacterized protein (DUF4415 family)
MKQRKRVTKRQKVATLRASAGDRKRLRHLPSDLARFYKPIKKAVTLRLDADVVAWFQRGGRGYQTRINRALRELMMEERNR